MECPYCNKYISSQLNHCIYCGGKIERSFIRKFLDFFGNKNIDEEKFIKSLANRKSPIIKSKRELELYVRNRVQDEEAAVIISEAFEKAGSEGIIEVKRGGNGNPYKLEYISNIPPINISKETKDRKKQLLQRIKGNLTKNERENIQSELAQLVHHRITIWVNSFLSAEEYNVKEKLMMDALEAAREGITAGIKTRNSNE